MTPPRSVDIAAVFSELREHPAPATRLHPRSAAPGFEDSSIGGPLLWPAVVCDTYSPEPCVLHPEQVIEFDDYGLPEELRARIAFMR